MKARSLVKQIGPNMPQASELSIDTKASADAMAEAIFGSGIKIDSASYTGTSRASGIYEDANETIPGIAPSDSGVILSTGRASSFTNNKGDVNTRSNTSTNNRQSGDDDLNDLSGVKTYDAAVLEAEFTPTGDTLTMQVVFSSEEYLEYCGSGFNDAVGIWVNGELAELTVGDGDITINNINDDSNSNLYIDNHHNDDVANTEMDGFTVTLTLKAPVNSGETNTIKIAIADGGDAIYDSNLLIAGNSVQTALVANDDEVEVLGHSASGVDVLGNDGNGGELTITHINGQPVAAGDTVTLSTGEEITLNDDGTFDIASDGDEETNTFTYSIEDEFGNTDTAFVKLTTTPCFVAGTLIKTVGGDKPVEKLRPGDLVFTRDHGPQPVRWVGKTVRIASGLDAPVSLSKNALGTHDAIAFSPNHRIFVEGYMAELLFERSGILAKSAHLVNGQSIRRVSDGRKVTYCHVLFDRHEVIMGNGLWSESYYPGAETLETFDRSTQTEIANLFGKSLSETFGPLAHHCLKAHETRVLVNAAGYA